VSWLNHFLGKVAGRVDMGGWGRTIGLEETSKKVAKENYYNHEPTGSGTYSQSGSRSHAGHTRQRAGKRSMSRSGKRRGTLAVVIEKRTLETIQDRFKVRGGNVACRTGSLQGSIEWSDQKRTMAGHSKDENQPVLPDHTQFVPHRGLQKRAGTAVGLWKPSRLQKVETAKKKTSKIYARSLLGRTENTEAGPDEKEKFLGSI